jgi:hypothetical protein
LLSTLQSLLSEEGADTVKKYRHGTPNAAGRAGKASAGFWSIPGFCQSPRERWKSSEWRLALLPVLR